MGQQSSALIESLPSYCKEEARKSKQCMYKFDYKREDFIGPCKEDFEAYKNCKARWLVLRKKVMNGTLLETPPKDSNDDSSSTGSSNATLHSSKP